MPEGGPVDVGDGEVRVGRRGDDDGVLAGRFRVDHHLWFPTPEESRCVGCAGEDDGVHRRVGDEVLAGLILGNVDELEEFLVDACFTKYPHRNFGDADDLWCRFDDDGRAGSEAGEHATHGDGQREVPRRGNEDNRVRGEPRSLDAIERASGFCVVAGEVDGLRDLGVGFRHGLVRLVRHGGQQFAAVRGQCVSGGVEHLGAVVPAGVAPRGGA